MSASTSKDRYFSTARSRKGSPSELQSHQFSLQTTGQGTFSNAYTAPRSSPSGRGFDLNPQAFYPQQWQSGNSPHIPPAFPNYDTTSSGHERQSPQPNYTTYSTSTRAGSPPVLGQMESRRAPPLSSSPGGDRWQQSASYGMPAVHGYHTSSSASLRSPTANYPNHYMPYPSGQSSSYTYVPAYDQVPLGQQEHGFDDMDSVHMSQQQQRPVSPYSLRLGSSQSHPSPPPISPTTADEPAIKKKRKRADANQLKVLNETYARTAFPSTEERHALAKLLDMSPRSVQIWFQNKRQSMRQTNRQSSTVSTSGHPQQPQFAMQGSQGGEMSHGYSSGSIALTESPYSAQDMGRGHASLSPSGHRRVRSPEEEAQRWSRDHY